jgi:hypothetical protein
MQASPPGSIGLGEMRHQRYRAQRRSRRHRGQLTPDCRQLCLAETQAIHPAVELEIDRQPQTCTSQALQLFKAMDDHGETKSSANRQVCVLEESFEQENRLPNSGLA